MKRFLFNGTVPPNDTYVWMLFAGNQPFNTRFYNDINIIPNGCDEQPLHKWSSHGNLYDQTNSRHFEVFHQAEVRDSVQLLLSHVSIQFVRTRFRVDGRSLCTQTYTDVNNHDPPICSDLLRGFLALSGVLLYDTASPCHNKQN